MQDSSNRYYRWLSLVLDPRWVEAVAQVWKLGRKMLRGLTNEGVYEVLNYECQIELKDRSGKLATIKKRERIRYLQDYITSYQDRAWGDGKVFLNYRCSPGTAVDEFRFGHYTCKLISLREFRNKGDVDEFNIEWDMRDGFLKSTGFWGTSMRYKTKNVAVKVIFPKGRPPLQTSLTESNLQKTRTLGPETQKFLADGRPVITWENANPRLYENYVLKWEW